MSKGNFVTSTARVPVSRPGFAIQKFLATLGLLIDQGPLWVKTDLVAQGAHVSFGPLATQPLRSHGAPHKAASFQMQTSAN